MGKAGVECGAFPPLWFFVFGPGLQHGKKRRKSAALQNEPWEKPSAFLLGPPLTPLADRVGAFGRGGVGARAMIGAAAEPDESRARRGTHRRFFVVQKVDQLSPEAMLRRSAGCRGTHFRPFVLEEPFNDIRFLPA